MLITVKKYIKDNGGKIGTSKKYAYKRNMLIIGMLVSGMQCIVYIYKSLVFSLHSPEYGESGGRIGLT